MKLEMTNFQAVAANCFRSAAVYCSPSRLTLPTRFGRYGARCAGHDGALRGMTTGKFVMGTLARLSVRRWAV